MDYNLVRQHASDIYRYGRNCDDRIIGSKIAFYQEGKKSPAIANLILNDQFKKSLQKYSKEMVEDIEMGAPVSIKENIIKAAQAINNNKISDALPEVQPALHEFAGNFQKLYPKTGFLRQSLIKNDRVLFDTVTPKANWITKMIKFSKFFK